MKKHKKSDGRNQEPKKILYLLGAGATHAELVNSFPEKLQDTLTNEKNGLLMANVSKRVCSDAKNEGEFSKEIKRIISPAGLSNIELFISLIEKNKIRSEDIVENLKNRIEKDINQRLRKPTRDKFCLHKSVLELHSKIETQEIIMGIVSLNYDNVIDEAYEEIIGNKPNYCLYSSATDTGLPLLKLHGGFKLKYRDKKLPILTPGIDKNYLELPYNFIWGRALELLIDCDVLRVIGCSLSQNDMGLVDLLFKAQLVRKEPYVLQMIGYDPDNNNIKENYGFLPRIERALEIDGGIIGDQSIKDYTTGANPFQIWLKAKVERMLDDDAIDSSKNIKRVLDR